jgi:hypothetical protein
MRIKFNHVNIEYTKYLFQFCCDNKYKNEIFQSLNDFKLIYLHFIINFELKKNLIVCLCV